MRTSLLLPALVGFLSVAAGCQSCSDTGTDGAQSDAVDVSADGDLLADIEDAVDVSPDSIGPAGDSTATDAAPDVPADVTVTLDPYCVKDLPMPGEACVKVGEIRCTNVGATLDKGNVVSCFRPNYLECMENSSSGKLAWSLAACSTIDPACKPNGLYAYCGNCAPGGYVCATGGAGDVCVPTVTYKEVPSGGQGSDGKNTNSPFNDMYQPQVCEGHEDMPAYCSPYAPIKCTKLADVEPAVKAEIVKVLGKCAAGLKDVPYLLPFEMCTHEMIDCYIGPGTAEKPLYSGPISLHACIVDPVTKKPRCAKTCTDLGKKELPIVP